VSDVVLFVKLLGAAAFMLVGFWVCTRPEVLALSSRRFDRLLFLALVGSRASAFIVVFFALGIPVKSDVIGHYVPQVESVLHGAVPYRDFPSSYGPLFPYIGAGLFQLWASPRVFVAVAIVLEIIALALWLKIARRSLGEDEARLAAALYVAGALPFFNVAIAGQNQVWILAFLGASLLLTLANRNIAPGLLAAAAVLAVKALALLFLPVLWLASKRRAMWLSAAVLPILAVALALLAAGMDFRASLASELGSVTSGNLPFLLSGLAEKVNPWWSAVWTGLLVAGLGGIWLVAQRKHSRDGRLVIYLYAAVLLIFLVLSRKSYTSYAMLGYFPLCALAVARTPRKWAVLGFGALGSLMTIEPSVWFRWFAAEPSLAALAATAAPERLVAFVALDVAIVLGYLLLLYRALALVLASEPSGAGTECLPERVHLGNEAG
jgi:hypothetical protein